MENWIDLRFASAEDFIKFAICSRAKPVIRKDKLLRMGESGGIEFPRNATKQEVLQALLDNNVTLEEIIKGELIGIGSIEFQKKFGISNRDVQRLAKAGFLKILAHKIVRFYGKCRKVPLYDAYQYFELTPEEVHAELAKCRRRKKNDSLED